MSYQTKNIIIGASAFYISKNTDQDTGGLPAKPTGTADTPLSPPAADWRNVGFTQEGVELSYEPEYGDVEVDQLLDSARIFKQSVRVMVNTTLAEATLENLLVAWGSKNTALASKKLNMLAGALAEAPIERSLLFIGPAPRTSDNKSQERVYHLARAIQTESTSFALRRSEVTALPASFRCLPLAATSDTEATYGSIEDRKTEA